MGGAPVSAIAIAQILVRQLAGFLALLLLVSALHKMTHGPRARIAARALADLPQGAAAAAVAAAALCELLAALLLLMPAGRGAGALVAACIWAAYLLLMLRALALGREDVDCGCSFSSTHRPLGLFQPARTAVLALIAAAVALAPRLGGGAAAGAGGDWIGSLGLPALAMLALYGALDQVMALRAPRMEEAR
jgi:hypothetical protein